MQNSNATAWNFEDPAFAGAAYVTELNRGHEGKQ